MKENKALSQKEYIEVIDSLYKGKSHEEKSVASILLNCNKEARLAVTLKTMGSVARSSRGLGRNRWNVPEYLYRG